LLVEYTKICTEKPEYSIRIAITFLFNISTIYILELEFLFEKQFQLFSVINRNHNVSRWGL